MYFHIKKLKGTWVHFEKKNKLNRFQMKIEIYTFILWVYEDCFNLRNNFEYLFVTSSSLINLKSWVYILCIFICTVYNICGFILFWGWFLFFFFSFFNIYNRSIDGTISISQLIFSVNISKTVWLGKDNHEEHMPSAFYLRITKPA